MAGAHIFDVDHTLTNGSTGKHFIRTAIAEKVLPSRVLLSLALVFLRYRLGLLKASQISGDLPLLKGKEHRLLEAVALRSFEERAKSDIFPDAVRLIESLRKEGELLMIATSSFDIIVQPLADYLGIETVLASSLTFVDGRCTGSFGNPPVFNLEKRDKVLEYLSDRGIDPLACAFYSDSVYDLPLLLAVGTPVVVNPDLMLARQARRRGWKTVIWHR